MTAPLTPPWLSLAIWIPILAGFVVMATGRDENARIARVLGTGLWQRGDVGIIDGWFVNGSARVVGWSAGVIRRVQSGYIYHYAFAMIIGLLLLLSVLLVWPQ